MDLARRVELEDRLVVVAGGTGLVGGFVVRALLAAGARVLVPTRRAESPGARPSPGTQDARVTQDARLTHVHVRTWDDPVEIAVAARAAGGPPDAVVAAIGGWWIGTELVDLAPDAWRELITSHLTAHFLVARALAPGLAAATDGVYVALNGAAAREPMAASGPVSVAGAGQAMLLDVLRAETIGRSVRFHEVSVLAAVAGDERNRTPVATVGGDAVARAVLGVLADPGSPRDVRVDGAPGIDGVAGPSAADDAGGSGGAGGRPAPVDLG